MLTICRTSKTKQINADHVISTNRRAVSTLMISSIVMLGLSGCGQKGALYLTDADGQAVQTSSAVLESTSNPQDAAFAGINDNNVNRVPNAPNAQGTQNAELPEPSNDPNDY